MTSSNNTNHGSLSISELIKNFPFSSRRHNQEKVLQEMCNAFNSDYKYIILEAPTGFGKSPVAMAVARTLGSSYICTSTKDLQLNTKRIFDILRRQKERITLLVW